MTTLPICYCIPSPNIMNIIKVNYAKFVIPMISLAISSLLVFNIVFIIILPTGNLENKLL